MNNLYVVINAQTRKQEWGAFTRKANANRRVRQARKEGRECFTVAIPKDRFGAWHAAYMKEHYPDRAA